MIQFPILLDVIRNTVESMSLINGLKVNFEPGRASQISESLTKFDTSITKKGKKYPMIAMLMPTRIETNLNTGYKIARIERIVIATPTAPTDPVLKRYSDIGTFKSVLYPCLNEFMLKLSNSPDVVSITKYTQVDNPSDVPVATGVRDYVDTIEILNLEFLLNQITNCL